MIYIPEKRTKLILIILSATITFHFVLLESQRFSLGGSWQVNDATKSQYETLLKKTYYRHLPDIIDNTKVEYLSGIVPEESIYAIYIMYFLIAVFIILIIRTSPKQNEERQLHSS